MFPHLHQTQEKFKNANLVCGQFWRILWIFLDTQQFFDSFLPINVHKSVFLSTINPCLLNNIQCMGKDCSLVHYYMIGKSVNLRIFFIPENWFAEENQGFPCLICTSARPPPFHSNFHAYMGHMDQDGKKVDEMSLFFLK